VGLTLPSLPTAATAPLPPSRFATGTAVFAMSRQVGSAIGVAIFVAIIGDATGPALLDAMRNAWWLILGCGLGAAGLAMLLPGSAAELNNSREMLRFASALAGSRPVEGRQVVNNSREMLRFASALSGSRAVEGRQVVSEGFTRRSGSRRL
jgi:hypothetical protein